MSAEKKKTTPFGKSEGAEPERFIPDGMGMFQRNVKRIGDCALAFLALMDLLRQLRRDYPEARILGDYQLSPYIRKACPCFDAREEYGEI